MGADYYCLASITTHECLESGKVVVKYCMTHTNHKSNLEECKHIPLPKSVSDRVRLLLASGVTIEKVLDGKCFFNS